MFNLILIFKPVMKQGWANDIEIKIFTDNAIFQINLL
jgi:hypothetical protein